MAQGVQQQKGTRKQLSRTSAGAIFVALTVLALVLLFHFYESMQPPQYPAGAGVGIYGEMASKELEELIQKRVLSEGFVQFDESDPNRFRGSYKGSPEIRLILHRNGRSHDPGTLYFLNFSTYFVHSDEPMTKSNRGFRLLAKLQTDLDEWMHEEMAKVKTPHAPYDNE